jgi:hypothetical protein
VPSCSALLYVHPTYIIIAMIHSSIWHLFQKINTIEIAKYVLKALAVLFVEDSGVI